MEEVVLLLSSLSSPESRGRKGGTCENELQKNDKDDKAMRRVSVVEEM
jgi:hypothetical protein